MKKFLALALVICITYLSFGQNLPRTQGQMPTGRFYGKVIDPSSKGIEAASVALVQTKYDTAKKKQVEVVLNGMLTTKTGDFSLENVPLFGKYKLRVTGIGFKTYEQAVAFDMPNRNAMTNAGNGGDPSALLGALDKDLGNIKLTVDEKLLSNITVTASKPLLTLGIDRKIFNVEKNITSVGGTAVDVMKNVPSLNVDIDGNVTLRNAAPTIFVDGRPTNMTLDQIPADAIESVEVITNPSAKFDASGGTAGILNIVMKKNKRVGYSGNVRTNIDSRGQVGLGGDINVRQNKINFFVSGQFMQRKSISTGSTDRTNFGNADTTYHTRQYDNSTGGGQFGFGRGGFDYFIDNRNTITVNGTLARGKFSPEVNSDIYVDSLLHSSTFGSQYQKRFSTSDNIFRNTGVQASYKHNFPKSGHEWTADLTYNEGTNTNSSSILTNYYKAQGQSLDRSYAQNQTGSGNNNNLILQTDYTNPLSENSKLEMGARMSKRTLDNQTDIFIASKRSTTIYNSTDDVYAAYATFSNRIKKFGYQAGLRVESSDYQGVLPQKGQTFKTQFPISLFPSLFLSEKVSDNDELQLNYSRRINRPNFRQLMPFTDYSDSLNITHGNPALQPEFTNSMELSFAHTFKNRDNFLASIYFKNTNNLITGFQELEFDTVLNRTIVANTFTNANRSYIYGLELIGKNKITKFWDLTSNFNFFTAKIDIPNQAGPDQFPSYFVKLNNSFKLPKNFSFQLSGDYTSKIISNPASRNGGGFGGFGGGGGGMFGGSTSASQGFIRPNYGVDAAVRFEFLKNKAASLSLNVNDIFRTRVNDIYTETSFFVQDVQRRRDPQVFRLNFNWRFGKFDASLFKRKDTKAENNIDNGGTNF